MRFFSRIFSHFSSHTPLVRFSHSSIQLQKIQGNVLYLCHHDERENVDFVWKLCESEVKVKVKSLSRVWLFANPWTVAYQAPPSTGFSRQEFWSGLPFPSPGDLPDPLKEKMWILFGSLVKCLPNLSKSDLFSENWSHIANFWLNSSA